MMAMKKAEKLSTLPHGAVIDTKPGGDWWLVDPKVLSNLPPEYPPNKAGYFLGVNVA